MSKNPWVVREPQPRAPEGWTTSRRSTPVLRAGKGGEPAGAEQEVEDLGPAPVATGPTSPQPGVPVTAGGLPVVERQGSARLWLVGAHGGAGETTVAGLDPHWRAAEHSWPALPAGAPAVCAVVARTNVSGLLAAQRALTQWAGAAAGPSAQCAALVLVDDAPGKTPAPIHDLIKHVGGGAPRVLRVGWVEEWRLGDYESRPPRSVRQLVHHLNELSPAPAGEEPTPKGK